MLLAVDLGVRAGLACFGKDGRLIWYRSRNFGSAARMRRAVRPLLDEIPALAHVVIEGGGDLVNVWEHEAERHGATARIVGAEVWRKRLLLQRDQRTGKQAKHQADTVARRVIEWSRAHRPTSLRHDAAEAILVGLWGVLEVGWLDRLPTDLCK